MLHISNVVLGIMDQCDLKIDLVKYIWVSDIYFMFHWFCHHCHRQLFLYIQKWRRPGVFMSLCALAAVVDYSEQNPWASFFFIVPHCGMWYHKYNSFFIQKSDHVISPNGFCDIAKSGLWYKNCNYFIMWYHSMLLCACKFISRHIVFPVSASFERRDLFLLFIHVNAGSVGMNVLSLSISCICGCNNTGLWHPCKTGINKRQYGNMRYEISDMTFLTWPILTHN